MDNNTLWLCSNVSFLSLSPKKIQPWVILSSESEWGFWSSVHLFWLWCHLDGWDTIYNHKHCQHHHHDNAYHYGGIKKFQMVKKNGVFFGGCGMIIMGGGYKVLFFNVHPYLGKNPNLTNLFQMGWNHQLVIICFFVEDVDVWNYLSFLDFFFGGLH